jgi:hypothetical protein
MRQNKTLTEIQKIAAVYTSCVAKINAIKSEHAAVFDALSELEDQRQGAEARMKDMARVQSVVGRTVRAYDDELMYVEVQGKQKGIEYDYSVALKSWDKAIFNDCRFTGIDSKKVEEAIQSGKISHEAAKKAELPRAAMTPSVSIKWK